MTTRGRRKDMRKKIKIDIRLTLFELEDADLIDLLVNNTPAGLRPTLIKRRLRYGTPLEAQKVVAEDDSATEDALEFLS